MRCTAKALVLFVTALTIFSAGPIFAAAPFISEFMADNAHVLADEDGQFPDWIEIQNPNSAPFDLAGYFLTDNPALLSKWAFPSTVVPGNSAIVIFASGKNRTNNPTRLHTNFQLDAGGGFVALVKPDGSNIVNAYNYPKLKEDVSFGMAQQQITTSLLATSTPKILVPASAAALPPDWNQPAYTPGNNWTNGIAPAAIGFDTNQAAGLPANVAMSGAAVQSTTLSASYPAVNAINGNFGDFSHTASADNSAFWQVTLTNQVSIYSVVLFNRTSCCQSRLRDITIEIISTNASGSVTNWISPLLNPENAGYSYPGGPANLSNNLVTITGGPVIGNIVRVRRAADPDLSGTGGQGNGDEANVLSLGEVVIYASAASGLRPYFTTDIQPLIYNVNASVFLRLPFVSTNAPESLVFNVRYDDGFIAYLNGNEIARRNAPATPAWNSQATADRNLGSAIVQESIDLSGAIPSLISGTNVLAVQMLNFSANNGDMLFQPELIATTTIRNTNVFLYDATPGTPNNSAWYLDEVKDTHFSVDRGFFEAPISLSITSGTPDAVIYYSFNADEPGPGKGFLYTGPITITNTTVVRARAFKDNWKPTAVDTHTYLFLADVIYQAKDWPAGGAPQYFPASWGRNRVDYGMDPNVVSQYSIAQWKEALTQIPTMSVVTEMKNLFDATTGIYANADGHGDEWERGGSLELLDPSNAVPGRFQENCGFRIRGGASRDTSFVKHSLRVFFRREYGAGKLHYPLFENEGAQEFETFDLRTSQNYAWSRETSVSNGTNDTMVREVFCRKTLGDMGQPYRRSRYYHLYVNGQYWGLYETDERPEASYGESYFGGSKTNYDVVKCANHVGNFVTEATDGNLIAFSNLWTLCRSVATNASNSNYFRILGRNPDGTRNTNMPVLLDVDNLIDYMLEIFYSGDGDATLSSFLSNNQPNNWFGMRDRTNPNVGFRFFNSDCEHTLGSPNSQVDRTGPFRTANIVNFTYANPQYMHEDLLWNAEYRQLFADHVQKHFYNGGALTFESCTNRFQNKAMQITKAIRAYSARWGDGAPHEPPYGESDWTNTINAILKTWFPPRAGIVLAQLRADNIASGIGAPAFSQAGGSVSAGFQLSLAQTNVGGVIYYTLDGSDPRAVGGGVAPGAQAYSAPIPINSPITVQARVVSNGTNWSGIIQYTFYPPQDFSKLLITEIMYHPPDVGLTNGDDFEFIELKNAGTNTLNLTGLRFTAGITYTFPSGSTIAPGGFYVLVRNSAEFASKYPGVTVNGVYTGGLDNGGETLTLSHPLGTKILSVTYDDAAPWPLTPHGYGFSLVPVNPNANADPNNPANWRASASAGGSPGADDAGSLVPPVLISEVLSHSEIGGDSIELFNPGTSSVNIGGWFLTDDPSVPMKFRIPANTLINPASYLVFNEAQFNPTPGTNNSFSLNARGDDVYLFSGDANTNLTGYSHGFSFGASPDGKTFGRYVISTGEEQFPEQVTPTLGGPNSGPRVGPVVITEIMYHAAPGGDEFIELKNISSNAVPLFDTANPTNTWRIHGLGFTFPTNVVLASNGIVLVVATNPAVFRAKYSVPANVLVFGPYTGSIQNSGESVTLERPDVPDTNGVAYIVVDAVRFNDKAPWPPAADGSGPSLQRRSAAAYGNDPANWEAALPTAGADFMGGQAPAIVVQPQSQVAYRGDTVTLNVTASGGALNYQWRLNGNTLAGATNAALVITNVQVTDAGGYSVFVFNYSGSAASAVAELTVKMPPTITLQPTNQFIRPGSNATFSVTATGNGLLRYQWKFNGGSIGAATNSFYVITNSQFANEGLYTVDVTDTEGTSTSAPAQLVILVDPLFVQGPLSQLVVTGATVVLSATVTNTATLPITYRLRRNSTLLPETLVTLNERSIFYTLTNVSGQFTTYAIAAANPARPGGLLSTAATLTFDTDADNDGIPDSWETRYGLSSSNGADANADTDGDGMLNWQEYVAGTDPTDRNSYLKINITASAGTTLTFGAISNRTYTIQSADAVGGPWVKIVDIVGYATNRIETITDSRSGTNRYYRVVTPRMP